MHDDVPGFCSQPVNVSLNNSKHRKQGEMTFSTLVGDHSPRSERLKKPLLAQDLRTKGYADNAHYVN